MEERSGWMVWVFVALVVVVVAVVAWLVWGMVFPEPWVTPEELVEDMTG